MSSCLILHSTHFDRFDGTGVDARAATSAFIFVYASGHGILPLWRNENDFQVKRQSVRFLNELKN